MKRLLLTTAIGAAGVLLVPLQACTNLDEVPPSAVSPGNFFRNETEVIAGLAGVYAQLRGTLDDYYDVSEISSDEMVVPTRGSDWYDGGQWAVQDVDTAQLTATLRKDNVVLEYLPPAISTRVPCCRTPRSFGPKSGPCAHSITIC